MNIILVKLMEFHYHVCNHFTLVTVYAAVFKPKHQICEMNIVMLEYPHIEDNNNPFTGAK
jgi:hypothetical protein